MRLEKEQKRVKKIGQSAWSYVMSGELRKARRELKKIRDSVCFIEAEQHCALVEAKILQCRNELHAARDRILESIGYLWGFAEPFEIISAVNDPIDADSVLMHLEVLGGCATIGAFTQFSDEHVGRFDVVASSLDEAMRYVTDVARFAAPERARVKSCIERPLNGSEFARKGVVVCYPFELEKEGIDDEHPPM